MQLYTIMPTDEEHFEEVCEDIGRQCREKIATCALFMMPLAPVGTPPVRKDETLCRKYDRFRDRLTEMGVPSGILVQSSIGHGGSLPARSPFTHYIGLADGKECEVVCPLDSDFKQFFRETMKRLASHHPSVIMLDDDFRLMLRAGRGCACGLHMKEFNRRAGTDMTREELWKHISTHPRDDRLRRIFTETQIDALTGAAREMRAGIDEVDEALPGIFCVCGNSCEGGAEIARIMAGKGNPVTVRVNNGNYTPAGPRFLSLPMLRAARQRTILGDAIDSFLAETDTCPQLRYSTSASSLHAHFTGSILEGASGAKHWLTRTREYETETGEAYRKILAKYAGFYEELARLVPTLSPLGCRIPIPTEPRYYYDSKSPYVTDGYGFASCVLERLGLPMYFSGDAGGAAFLDGDGDAELSDDEIRAIFRGKVFLAADTALRLWERGFGEQIGVRVGEPLSGVSGESYPAEKMCSQAQVRARELILPEGARADSFTYRQIDEKREILSPAVAVFDNPSGGQTVVFAGTPKTDFHYSTAFSFLSNARKAQFVRLLGDGIPVFYPGDEEVYFRAAGCADGTLLAALFNIGLDRIDNVRLSTARRVGKIEMLTPDGTRKEVGFAREGNILSLDIPADILHPVILFLS